MLGCEVWGVGCMGKVARVTKQGECEKLYRISNIPEDAITPVIGIATNSPPLGRGAEGCH